MAMYSDQSYETEAAPSAEDIQGMMVEKAHELFAVCDVENKGFITKRDMQRLQVELPLTPPQLEDVFDSLDDDHNGFLTLAEFTDGFGKCLYMLRAMVGWGEVLGAAMYCWSICISFTSPVNNDLSEYLTNCLSILFIRNDSVYLV